MSYVKTNWVDGQNKYDIKTQADVVINSDVKLVYSGVGGIPISASNLNKLEQGVYDAHQSLFPTGVITMWSTNTAPTGYVLCDGSAISRTTYASLYAVIGTTYGSGDGSTTFNLPNLKGRIPVGRDAAQTEFDVLGETGGEKTHLLTIAEMPSHTHTYTRDTDTSTGAQTVSSTNKIQQDSSATTDSTGGDTTHNNLQPYIVLNYIIKY